MDGSDRRSPRCHFLCRRGFLLFQDRTSQNYPKISSRIQGEEWYLMPVVLLSQNDKLKTWIKQAGIKDVGAYLSVRDAQELSCEKPVIKVSSRGYMRGYCRLGKDVKGLYRLLSYIGDEWIGMKIVRLDFGV